MSEKRYQIWAGGKQASNQDIATLFYTRCAELYARPGTQIGMVMPHSALRAGQHLKWRGGNYKRKGRGERNAPSIGLNLQVHEPWDLDNVVPDFFPMPASVVFAQYIGARSRRATGAGNRAGLATATGRKTTPASVGRAKSSTTTTASSSHPTQNYPAKRRGP